LMLTKMRRFIHHLTAFFVLVILCTVALDNIPALNEPTTGSCGENVEWSFDRSTEFSHFQGMETCLSVVTSLMSAGLKLL